MKVNPSIYKAYDIRGIYGTDLTEDIVYQTARAYAQLLLHEHSKQQLTIVVGRDARISSPSLSQQIIQGLCAEGLNVIDIGLVSTPAFYFAVAYYNYSGGIMISASHNAAEYNGLKMVRAGGVPISKDTGIYKIRDMVIAMPNRDTFNYTSVKSQGVVTQRNDIVIDHVNEAIKFSGLNNIKPFKIIADAANGMGATYLHELFKRLPGEKIEMNFTLDGTFPVHEADPFKLENNRLLMDRVIAEQADLGIATDGDGDRIFFIDNEGKMINPAIIRGILAKLFLETNPGATICYDIRPGRITRDMIEQAGGKSSVTKVGHSLIKEQALKENAVFAGESSGHFFVKMDYGLFEAPCIVILKLLQYFSRVDLPIAEQIKPLCKYFHSGEINSVVEDKEQIMQKLLALYKSTATTTATLDGITIEYPDYWFNVRASNTESLLRLNLEAISQDLQEQKTEEILKIIRG